MRVPGLGRDPRARVEALHGPHGVSPLASPWRPRPSVRRALLIYPPTGLFDRSDRCQTPLDYALAQPARSPLDLALLAAALEARGVACTILDLPASRQGWPALAEAARRQPPDLLVLTTTAFTLDDDLLACALVRSLAPGCRTVMKGYLHGTDAAGLIDRHPALDAVSFSEDELAVARLIDSEDPVSVPGFVLRVADGQVIRTGKPPSADLDALPAAARHLLDNRLYLRPDTRRPLATVLVQRGCPYPCTFCLVPVVSGRDGRMRSPERIAAEVAECVQRHGIGDFLFKADTFNLDRRWALEVCRAVGEVRPAPRWMTNSRLDGFDAELASAMAGAGCWMVAFGLETGAATVQRQAAKELEREQVRRALRAAREAGLRSLLYLTIGLPGETRATVGETVRFVRTLDWDFAEVHLAVAFPGTPLYQQASNQGLLALPLGGPRGGGAVPHLIRSEALSHGELASLRLRVMVELYGSGLRIARSALSLPGGVEAVINLVRMAVPKMARNLAASWRLDDGGFVAR